MSEKILKIVSIILTIVLIILIILNFLDTKWKYLNDVYTIWDKTYYITNIWCNEVENNQLICEWVYYVWNKWDTEILQKENFKFKIDKKYIEKVKLCSKSPKWFNCSQYYVPKDWLIKYYIKDKILKP